MSEISPAELQELQQATTQRIAQLLIARQRTGKDTHYYGIQAERFKKLAADNLSFVFSRAGFSPDERLVLPLWQ